VEPKQFTIFKNSFVYVLTKELRSSENKVSGPTVISGFLTDFCHTNYYFSETPMGEITDSVRVDSIVRMFLPIQELSSILEQHGSNGEELN